MRRFHSIGGAMVAAAAGLLAPGEAKAADCLSLRGKSFGEATVFLVEEIQGGGVRIAGLDRGQFTTLSKPMCRVRAIMQPVAGSSIQFELWLPPEQSWNGKYLGVGNGAFTGAVMFHEMARPFARGYAVSSTDTGHVSTGQESRWALGQPERVADWAWRSHHLTAVASKQIVEAYYGARPKFSYFLGCSKGGSSAMKEAQRFPEDYDGIVAGAPGIDQTGQITSYLWTQQAVAAPGGWIGPAKLAVLHRAVLAACPSENGYLVDPGRCTFDPARLRCKGADSPNCLTDQQVTTVRKIYSGPLDERGRSFYPGLARGSELNWSRLLMGPEDRPATGAWIYANMIGYMGNVLFGRTDIDFTTLQPLAVRREAISKLAATVDASNPDLSAFAARGGKLIHFHGWNDPIVRPAASPNYYDQVVATMGGLNRVQSFYRLFMGPGMDHCSGGVGPNAAGGPHNGPAPSQDPRHDLLSALEAWVEQRRAPEQIVATLYRDGEPGKGVAAQRPWCPYPAISVYSGQGDRRQASSYVCRRR